jgi:hypothetical protein
MHPEIPEEKNSRVEECQLEDTKKIIFVRPEVTLRTTAY